jgi:UDP-N-acetyl-D-glucosamine dehydrogenase
VFAETGFQVIGIDTDRQKVERANRGESYISDVSSSLLKTLIGENRLHCTSDYTALDDVDVISICVPTPCKQDTRSR